MTSPILISGHRGLGTTDNQNAQKLRDTAHIIPENTLEALTGGLTIAGADFIEFDAVPAKDGIVITHSARLSDHIFSTLPATHTTELTVAELQALTTGHRGAPTDRIATLDELLAAITPIVKVAPNRFINLEMKEVQHSGLNPCLDDIVQYVGKVHASVQRHGMMERTLFSSFNSANLQALLHIAPEAKIAQLFDVPEGDGTPIYGDDSLARYMAFTPEHVVWALENMPTLSGLNPPVQAFMAGGRGAEAMQAAQDWCQRHNRPLPGLYIWAGTEQPVDQWIHHWQNALDIAALAPTRAVITDYPAAMRQALKL